MELYISGRGLEGVGGGTGATLCVASDISFRTGWEGCPTSPLEAPLTQGEPVAAQCAAPPPLRPSLGSLLIICSRWRSQPRKMMNDWWVGGFVVFIRWR